MPERKRFFSSIDLFPDIGDDYLQRCKTSLRIRVIVNYPCGNRIGSSLLVQKVGEEPPAFMNSSLSEWLKLLRFWGCISNEKFATFDYAPENMSEWRIALDAPVAAEQLLDVVLKEVLVHLLWNITWLSQTAKKVYMRIWPAFLHPCITIITIVFVTIIIIIVIKMVRPGFQLSLPPWHPSSLHGTWGNPSHPQKPLYHCC